MEIRPISAEEMHRLRDRILDIQEAAYVAVRDNPFYSRERYWGRLEVYATRDGFGMMVGELDGDLIGYSMGYPLPATTRWWEGLRTDDPDPTLTQEDGARTFALTELVVHPSHQRRGYGRALHDALLARRPEKRATLLVRPDNIHAKRAYLSWGWRQIGVLQPFSDSPVYDSLIRDLP